MQFILLILLNSTTQVLPDGGGWYAETDLSHTIVEPWNAYSSLAFLVPVIYWLYRLRGKYTQNQFLVGCMPLLTLGGLGSTFYHAFRSSYYLLLLDVLPIFLLTMAVSLYFWWKVLQRWDYVIVIAIVFFFGRLSLHFSDILSRHHTVNISYFITGVMIFLPALLLLRNTEFRGAKMIILATAFFIISLIFRRIDVTITIPLMPMGTHWLWHVFCSIGTFFLAEYLYLVAKLERRKVTV